MPALAAAAKDGPPTTAGGFKEAAVKNQPATTTTNPKKGPTNRQRRCLWSILTNRMINKYRQYTLPGQMFVRPISFQELPLNEGVKPTFSHRHSDQARRHLVQTAQDGVHFVDFRGSKFVGFT